MKIDDSQWRDPDGYGWTDDLAYGQGDPQYASGLWWLIPVVLVLYGIGVWYGWVDVAQ